MITIASNILKRWQLYTHLVLIIYDYIYSSTL